ncbi:MAG: hypothetical protein JW984_09815 [Deltaproteobacteria bacterium]|uniref:Uncharacterized protein n=1 Tax=Candidatus Zymogenus saltonus TaxID=2844893 RepID=A0A9D8KFZ1_9DELT|nr:hypothetical protein [Candidatus Zymogenus saltonus]
MSGKKFSDWTIRLAKFCKDRCVVRTRAREKGSGFLHQMVKIERHFCPTCRAYEKVYGVPAYMIYEAQLKIEK